MWIGISAAGVFATEDGGKTWERRNRLSNAEACAGHDHPAAPRDGEIGHCVHNIMRAPGPGSVLYQQNHHGVWRSADGGRSWDDITAGLPSTFGFPIRVHPRDPQMIWTVPLNGDQQGRFPPGAAAAVWKSSDGGKTWSDKRAGAAAEVLLLHRPAAGDGGGYEQPGGRLFRHQHAGRSSPVWTKARPGPRLPNIFRQSSRLKSWSTVSPLCGPNEWEKA